MCPLSVVWRVYYAPSVIMHVVSMLRDLPIRKPWLSGCAVPNHSYNIGNVEVPLNKGVCKELLAKFLPCQADKN